MSLDREYAVDMLQGNAQTQEFGQVTGKRVLIVEDEVLITTLIVDVLEFRRDGQDDAPAPAATSED